MLAPVPDDVCVSNSEEPAHLNIDVLDVQGGNEQHTLNKKGADSDNYLSFF